MVCDFVAGGSGDEVTLRANRAAFARWRLLPRVLRGLREVSTATTVLGQEIALPVLIAPPRRAPAVHDEGELATARAARAAGTIYTMSTAATFPIEEVAPRGRTVVVPALRLHRSRASPATWSRGPRRPGRRRWSSPSTRRCSGGGRPRARTASRCRPGMAMANLRGARQRRARRRATARPWRPSSATPSSSRRWPGPTWTGWRRCRRCRWC